MGVNIVGGISGTSLDVNSNNEAKMALTLDASLGGFVNLAAESDPGTITGNRQITQLEASRDYRLRVGSDTLLFNAYFPGAALDTGRFTQILSTMTLTVSAGSANLNAGLSTANAAYAQLRTYRSFPTYDTFTIWGQTQIQFSQLPITNNIVEVGFFLAAAATAPTDGVFMRYTSGGLTHLVVNNVGTETQSEFSALSYLVANTTNKISIGISDEVAELWINDVLATSLPLPLGAGSFTACKQLPFAIRTYNVSATSAAMLIKVGAINITLGEAQTTKPWNHVLCGMGCMGYEGQVGGTLGSTALLTNNLAAGVGVAATNTTAALGSGLGGQFSLQPTLTAGTDGVISSYQVPVGTAALPGRSLYITGVKIHGIVTTALTGGPVLGLWSLAYGSTSVNLTTGEAATTKAPRRIPLGIQTYVVTAPVGARDDREINQVFQNPVVVQPGEFVQTVFKNLGVVTTVGVITFSITFDSYWE